MSEIDDISSFKINSTTYKKDFELYLENETDNPVFIIIKNVLKTIINDIYFVYYSIETIGANTHLESYEVMLLHEKFAVKKLIQFKNDTFQNS